MIGNVPTNANTTQNSGSQTQATPVLISQEQLRKVRTAEKHETKGGASSDAVSADLGGRFSAFLAAGAGTLQHYQNAFEQGYHSTLPSVTVGGDYRVNPKLITGLAFNYFNQDGDFTSAGGFNVNSYSPLVYLNYAPFDRAFANVILGYARQNDSYSRLAQILKPGQTEWKSADAAPRMVSADFHRNLLSAYVQTGYDYTLSANDNFTLGPRLGLNVQHWMTDDYQESSNTGLELHYREPDQTSVQTTIGFTAAWALTTSIGIVSPYFTAGWVHEFANAQRTIHARFVQAPASQEFTFETENPARNWALLDLGVSLLMSPKLSVFVAFSTVQGNANFESYGGIVGFRGYW
jgi:outer membrane autotransporter protein